MTVRPARHHVGRIVAVIVAGTALGIGGTFALTAARSAPLEPGQQNKEFAAVITWATSQHLTGLSPASLGAPDSSPDREAGGMEAAVVQFAVAAGLSGLSPASMHSIGTPPSTNTSNGSTHMKGMP